MKFSYGSSEKGDVSEALKFITAPAALFFFCCEGGHA